MDNKRITAIYGNEAYPLKFDVGEDGVDAIHSRTDNFGDHGIGWFDVYVDGMLSRSVSHRVVAQVIWQDRGE